MNIIFFNKKSNKHDDEVDKILSKLINLNHEKSALYLKHFELDDELNVNFNIDNCYKELSDVLFNLIDLNDFDGVKKILSFSNLAKDKLLDNKLSLDPIEYCLENGKNDVFVFIYKKLFNCSKLFFKNIPCLFTRILKRKNFELIEFFLTDKFLSTYIEKENIINLLFLAFEDDKSDLINLIINVYDNYLDERNIEAIAIYFLSNKNSAVFKKFLSYKVLASRLTLDSIKKLIILAIFNNYIDGLEIMIKNDYCIELIMNLNNNDIYNNISSFAKINNNEEILNFIDNINKYEVEQ